MQYVNEKWSNNESYFVGRYKMNGKFLVPVFHVRTQFALAQLIGYAKYLNRKEGNVYFRGQTKLYRTMTPAIYRGIKPHSVQKRNEIIIDFVKKASGIVSQLGKDTPEYTREPLLQHYGIKTRWIDVVDNLWTSLLFTTLVYSKKKLDRIYTYVSRAPIKEAPTVCTFAAKPEIEDNDLASNPESYSYLMLLLNDQSTEVAGKPGYYAGADTISIDLRKAAPSIFLRPHCQHALLIRSKSTTTLENVDLSQRVNLIVRLDRMDVTEWLGNGRLVDIDSIYPSIYHDHGFGTLYEQAPHEKKSMDTLGTIEQMCY